MKNSPHLFTESVAIQNNAKQILQICDSNNCSKFANEFRKIRKHALIIDNECSTKIENNKPF